MSTRRTRGISRIACVSALLLALTACAGRYAPRFIPNGSAHTAASALRLLDEPAPSTLTRLAADDAEQARQAALTALRRRGELGTSVARLLTETFPSSGRGVPYRVERGRFDGAACWIVLEATGRPGGTLDGRRLWVLSDEGEVLFFGSR